MYSGRTLYERIPPPPHTPPSCHVLSVLRPLHFTRPLEGGKKRKTTLQAITISRTAATIYYKLSSICPVPCAMCEVVTKGKRPDTFQNLPSQCRVVVAERLGNIALHEKHFFLGCMWRSVQPPSTLGTATRSPARNAAGFRCPGSCTDVMNWNTLRASCQGVTKRATRLTVSGRTLQ